MNEEVIQIVLNSQTPPELPVAPNIANNDIITFWSISNGQLEQTTANNLNLAGSGNFITIDNNIFRLIKGYTGTVKNTQGTLETNDIIANAVIRNNNVNLLIKSARYNGGTSTDFGTYNPTTGEFTGGSYTVLDYIEI